MQGSAGTESRGSVKNDLIVWIGSNDGMVSRHHPRVEPGVAGRGFEIMVTTDSTTTDLDLPSWCSQRDDSIGDGIELVGIMEDEGRCERKRSVRAQSSFSGGCRMWILKQT